MWGHCVVFYMQYHISTSQQLYEVGLVGSLDSQEIYMEEWMNNLDIHVEKGSTWDWDYFSGRQFKSGKNIPFVIGYLLSVYRAEEETYQ